MRVPRCKECELCKEYDISYKYLYCSVEEKQICAGTSIKASPKCDSKNNNPNLREVYIEDDGNLAVVPYLCDDTESVQIKINYCPMCGKELH